jgi:hypothetical protein
MSHPPSPPHADQLVVQSEEHELPCLEAVLAGTLALMTGHSQALQAELHPQQRLAMGAKVADNLALLGHHPMLSSGFRDVLLGLQRRWHAMRECTQQAACECGPVAEGDRATSVASRATFHVSAPETLQ